MYIFVAGNIKSVKPQLLYSIGSQKNILHDLGDNACGHFIGAKCPLKTGDQVVYVIKKNIPTNLSPV